MMRSPWRLHGVAWFVLLVGLSAACGNSGSDGSAEPPSADSQPPRTGSTQAAVTTSTITAPPEDAASTTRAPSSTTTEPMSAPVSTATEDVTDFPKRIVAVDLESDVVVVEFATRETTTLWTAFAADDGSPRTIPSPASLFSLGDGVVLVGECCEAGGAMFLVRPGEGPELLRLDAFSVDVNAHGRGVGVGSRALYFFDPALLVEFEDDPSWQFVAFEDAFGNVRAEMTGVTWLADGRVAVQVQYVDGTSSVHVYDPATGMSEPLAAPDLTLVTHDAHSQSLIAVEQLCGYCKASVTSDVDDDGGSVLHVFEPSTLADIAQFPIDFEVASIDSFRGELLLTSTRGRAFRFGCGSRGGTHAAIGIVLWA